MRYSHGMLRRLQKVYIIKKINGKDKIWCEIMDGIIIFIAAAMALCLVILFFVIIINSKKCSASEEKQDDWKNYISNNYKFFEKNIFWIKAVILVLTYLMDQYNSHSYYLLVGLIVFILLEIETQILAFGFAKKKIVLGKK